MEMKSLPWCEKTEVMEDHNKTTYECHNVTKQHCTSLWKIVNGVKVWAGNDDCRNVTWEECKPTIQTVKWMVPKMNCTPELFTYLSFENKTTNVDIDVETCTVETRSVCSRVKRTDCGIIDVRNCEEVSQSFSPTDSDTLSRAPSPSARWWRSRSRPRTRYTSSGVSLTRTSLSSRPGTVRRSLSSQLRTIIMMRPKYFLAGTLATSPLMMALRTMR